MREKKNINYNYFCYTIACSKEQQQKLFKLSRIKFLFLLVPSLVSRGVTVTTVALTPTGRQVTVLIKSLTRCVSVNGKDKRMVKKY